MMIEKDISNQDLMRDAKISANIITKIRRGQYMALDKLESICMALGYTPLTIYWNLYRRKRIMSNDIKLFEGNQIRSSWNNEKEEWYFSIVDIIGVLTDSKDSGAYWRKLKQMWLNEVGKERKENPRDNMSTTELILNMLAETAAKDIAESTNPQGLEENKKVAKRDDNIAGNARKEIEVETGKPVITSKNAIDFGKLIDDVTKTIGKGDTNDDK